MDKILWFAVAVLSISEVLSLQCYVCNTFKSGDDCASADRLKSSPQLLQNCSELPDGERYTYCRKMVHQIHDNKGKVENRIVRECGYLNTTINTCRNIGMHKDAGQIMCSCDADECNSSSQLQSQKSCVYALTFTVISFFYKLLLIA